MVLYISQHMCSALDELDPVIYQQQTRLRGKAEGLSENLVCDLDGRLCDLRKERPQKEEVEGVTQTA